MEKILRELADWGCDVEGTRERFMDDTELYMTCLRTVVDDPAYEKLGEALERQDKKEAFDYAHTLKGVLGNMGLTPIYNVVIRIVEPLRNETNENLEQIYEELLAENNRLRRIIEN